MSGAGARIRRGSWCTGGRESWRAIYPDYDGDFEFKEAAHVVGNEVGCWAHILPDCDNLPRTTAANLFRFRHSPLWRILIPECIQLPGSHMPLVPACTCLPRPTDAQIRAALTPRPILIGPERALDHRLPTPEAASARPSHAHPPSYPSPAREQQRAGRGRRAQGESHVILAAALPSPHSTIHHATTCPSTVQRPTKTHSLSGVETEAERVPPGECASLNLISSIALSSVVFFVRRPRTCRNRSLRRSVAHPGCSDHRLTRAQCETTIPAHPQERRHPASIHLSSPGPT